MGWTSGALPSGPMGAHWPAMGYDLTILPIRPDW